MTADETYRGRHRIPDPPAPAGEDPAPPKETPTMLARFREPVLTASTLLTPAVGLILLFVADLDPATQAAWNGTAVAVAGLITAALAARERLAPAILGFAQALLQILAVFGFGLNEAQTTGVLGFVSLAVGMYLRTQVWAAVAADGTPREPSQLRPA